MNSPTISLGLVFLLPGGPTLVQEPSNPRQGEQAAASRPATPGQARTEKKQDEPFDDEEFCQRFLNEGLLGRLQLAPVISRLSEHVLVNKVLPRLTGERSQLILEVKNLVAGLGDIRYRVREESERLLLNMGPQIIPILEELPRTHDFETRVRLTRVQKNLGEMGDEDIRKKAEIARGLAEVLEYRPGAVTARALLSGLDHLDPRVRLASIRSLGAVLRDPELLEQFGNRLFDRIVAELDSIDLELRNATLSALGGLALPRSATLLKSIVVDRKRPMSLRILALRVLVSRAGTNGLEQLELDNTDLVAVAADFFRKRAAERAASKPEPQDPAATRETDLLRVKLRDIGEIRIALLGLEGDKLRFVITPEFEGLPELRIPRASIDQILMPPEVPRPAGGDPHLLLKSGTRLAVKRLVIKEGKCLCEALGRSLVLPMAGIRSILADPGKARILGGSRKHDQVRTRTSKEPIAGTVERLDYGELTIRDASGRSHGIPFEQVTSILFSLGERSASAGNVGDLNQYVQVDLRDGQKLVGFLLALDERQISIAADSFGCLSIDLARISSIQLSNSGRALTGFTLVCDYGEARVFELDGEGHEVWSLEDLFDPLDAELTPSGNILVTEQKDNAVREYDREGNIVWEYDDLEHPRDADVLPNGNILITDTSNLRVIEVDRDKRIVWTFGKKQARSRAFRPYDADRLANGNTLIADNENKRVIEVNPSGQIVWEQKNTVFVYDADRLPSGNTLITVHATERNRKLGRVFEVDRQGNVVWELTPRYPPFDADRLPDGTTLVAEDNGVRVYSRELKVLRELNANWATEANGY
ncbi:MAG: PQQ-binding-like beta-propeller repeat protein [Planctomycetota bacterium]